MYEDAGALPGHPLVNVVRRNFREQKSAFTSPDRSFRPFVETGRHSFQCGVGRHKFIESRIELLNHLGDGCRTAAASIRTMREKRRRINICEGFYPKYAPTSKLSSGAQSIDRLYALDRGSSGRPIIRVFCECVGEVDVLKSPFVPASRQRYTAAPDSVVPYALSKQQVDGPGVEGHSSATARGREHPCSSFRFPELSQSI